MKVCKDCKNICKCEYVWPSKPCEKWEPTLERKAWLLGYIDGYDDGALSFDPICLDALNRLIEVKAWLREHGKETPKGEQEMKEGKYSVFDDNEPIAQHMTLEIANMLVQALFENWQSAIQMAKKRTAKMKCLIKKVYPRISIARESEEEE